MANYIPQPIDTRGIELEPELRELTEKLAASTHDQWSLLRMSQGWRLGPKRDDDAKLHPNLVPYDDLTEEDKEYDRRTAMETLKAIIALGFEIRKR